MKFACQVENNEIPSLNQLVKDHKEQLATRPVCRAQVKQAPNGPLSSLVCEILDPYVQEADKGRNTDLKSTEELCHEMKTANENILKNGVKRGPFQLDGGLLVGSKDVDCHYGRPRNKSCPRLLAPTCQEANQGAEAANGRMFDQSCHQTGDEEPLLLL